MNLEKNYSKQSTHPGYTAHTSEIEFQNENRVQEHSKLFEERRFRNFEKAIFEIFAVYFSKRLILPITAILILLTLGTWQVVRSKEKSEFLLKTRKTLTAPPKNLKNIDSEIIYSKFEIFGKFLDDKSIFLYGNRNLSDNKNGYYLLSPFIDSDGRTLLILRGWVKDMLPLKNTENTEKITIFAMPGEKENMFIPSNDIKNNIWFTINLKLAQKLFNVDVLDYYFIQINGNNLPYNVKPVSVDKLMLVQNKHIEYALTWYALALILIIIMKMNKCHVVAY